MEEAIVISGAPEAGAEIGPYTIVREIGRGGMGIVCLARDQRLDREVALKFLSAELTRDPQARTRFLAEARAAARLDHPNICTIHDIGETPNGHAYIAMSYYEGRTLEASIADGAPTLARSGHRIVSSRRTRQPGEPNP